MQIIDFWSIKMSTSSQISTTTTKTVFVRCPPPAFWDLGPSWVKRGETDRVYVIPKLLRLVGWSLGSLLWHVPPVSRPAYPDLCGLCRHNVGFHIFSLQWVWNGFASQPRILTFSPLPCPKNIMYSTQQFETNLTINAFLPYSHGFIKISAEPSLPDDL